MAMKFAIPIKAIIQNYLFTIPGRSIDLRKEFQTESL